MSYDRYDTSVTKLVQNNPLAFVDRLNEAASIYPGADVFLREAACVIANLLLTDEDWHNDIETGTHDDAIGYAPNGAWCGECLRTTCVGCPTWDKIRYGDSKHETNFTADEMMWRRFDLLVDGEQRNAFVDLIIQKGITRDDLIQILNSVRLNMKGDGG